MVVDPITNDVFVVDAGTVRLIHNQEVNSFPFYSIRSIVLVPSTGRVFISQRYSKLLYFDREERQSNRFKPIQEVQCASFSGSMIMEWMHVTSDETILAFSAGICFRIHSANGTVLTAEMGYPGSHIYSQLDDHTLITANGAYGGSRTMLLLAQFGDRDKTFCDLTDMQWKTPDNIQTIACDASHNRIYLVEHTPAQKPPSDIFNYKFSRTELWFYL